MWMPRARTWWDSANIPKSKSSKLKVRPTVKVERIGQNMERALVQLCKLIKLLLNIKIQVRLSLSSLKCSKLSTYSSSKLIKLSNSSFCINSNVGFNKPRTSLKLGNNSSFCKMGNPSEDKKIRRSLPVLQISPEWKLRQRCPKLPSQFLQIFWLEVKLDRRLTDNSVSHISNR